MRPPSATLPPNPCLTAILLVTKTRAGPRLVFHYPSVPSLSSASSSHNANWYGTPGHATDDADSIDSDWSSGSADGGPTDDDDDEGSRSSRAWSRGSRFSGGRTGSKQDTSGSFRSTRTKSAPGGSREELDEDIVEGERATDGESAGPEEAKEEWKAKEQDEREWDRVLGFSADALGMLLTPARSFNKRRFEVGLDPLVFVGAPMFVRDDGLWKKKRRKKRSSGGGESDDDGVSQHDHAHDVPDAAIQLENNQLAVTDVVETTNKMGTLSMADLEQVPGFESAYGHGLMSGAASDIGSEAKSASSVGGDGDMTMFNVVFVLNTPTLEHHIRVEEMYDYVVKRFAKALKDEQAQSSYVSKEVRLISSMKEKAKETKEPIFSLWPNIISKSPLAKAIAITYNQISANKIAHINLSDAFDTSFQIPQAISTPYIPTPTEPQISGLWLTTATLLDDDDMDTMLSPHSALLLLQDDEVILKEVESDGKELSGPLSFFIRNLTPTKSLQKLSQMHSMSLKDVQFLARHLIYWRRARAIPPLRWGDVYIVSPNANMQILESAIHNFETRFPTLPSLPKILHMLSGPPRAYSTLMPSKDHRLAYMEILAWLMRGGWVTQLRTFGWVRVKPEVKAAVAEDLNKGAKPMKRSGGVTDGPLEERSNGQTRTAQSLTPSNPFHRSPEGREPGASDAPFAYSSQVSTFLSPAAPTSDAWSTGSEQIPISGTTASIPPLPRPESGMLRQPSPLHINQSAPSSSDEQPSTSGRTIAFPSGYPLESLPSIMSTDPADYDASLVDSPQKADALQSRWIEHIGLSFQDEELKELWPLLLKYFDGRHALEEISVRENMKKKKVVSLLGLLTRGGWLITVRHW
jgi:hypothetical protein